MSLKNDEIFEKITESFDPITGEKIEKRENFVYRYDKNTGEKIEKKVIDIEEKVDTLTGEKILVAITEEDLLKKQENIENKQIHNGTKESKQQKQEINTNKPKKSKLPLFIGAGVVIAIIVISTFFINFIKKPYIKVAMGIKNTAEKNIKEIDDIFGIKNFYKSLDEGNFNMEVKFSEPILGIGGGFNLGVKNNEEKNLNVKLLNLDIFDIFLDKTDIYIQSKLISDDVYVVNNEDLSLKLDELLKDGYLTKEQVELLKYYKDFIYNASEISKIMKDFYKDLSVNVFKILENIEYEKIKDGSLKGYRFNVKAKDLDSFLDLFIKEVNKNEKVKEIYKMIVLLNYVDSTNIKEVKEEVDFLLNHFTEGLKQIINQYGEDFVIISLDTYLSNGYLQKAILNIPEIELKITTLFNNEKNSSLNVNISISSYDEIIEINCTGENTDEKFITNLSIEDKTSKLNEKIKILYNKNDNTISMLSNEDDTIIKGKINKLVPGKEIDTSFNSSYEYIKIDFKLSNNVENIKKPEGTTINLLELTEKDLENIINNMYKKFGIL